MSLFSSSSLLFSAAVRQMKPPGNALAVRLQNALQPLALFIGRNLARDADMLDGRHVDDETARQSDVRRDARALLAERLFGDLNDDLLAFFQKVGDGGQAAGVRVRDVRVRTFAFGAFAFGRSRRLVDPVVSVLWVLCGSRSRPSLAGLFPGLFSSVLWFVLWAVPGTAPAVRSGRVPHASGPHSPVPGSPRCVIPAAAPRHPGFAFRLLLSAGLHLAGRRASCGASAAIRDAGNGGPVPSMRQ